MSAKIREGAVWKTYAINRIANKPMLVHSYLYVPVPGYGGQNAIAI
jgi:hypothetical protein